MLSGAAPDCGRDGPACVQQDGWGQAATLRALCEDAEVARVVDAAWEARRRALKPAFGRRVWRQERGGTSPLSPGGWVNAAL